MQSHYHLLEQLNAVLSATPFEDSTERVSATERQRPVLNRRISVLSAFCGSEPAEGEETFSDKFFSDRAGTPRDYESCAQPAD